MTQHAIMGPKKPFTALNKKREKNMTFQEWSDIWDVLFKKQQWAALLDFTKRYQKQWSRGLD